MNRPNWNEYFILMCNLVATRSTCKRRKVGAVLIKDKRVLATGYNGPPKNNKHCVDLGSCLREKLKIPSGQRDEICRAVHAEANCIAQAAKYGGGGIKGSTLYCTNHPCIICAKLIANTGIVKVIFQNYYEAKMARDILTDSGVALIHFTPSLQIIVKEIE